jgi:hypothetical protein
MKKLYTYCIPYDNGSAPNPYWGICTLVICKPVIRRTAQIGDWIVATGSKNDHSLGNISDKIVYAMKVTDKKTMRKYDEYCKENLKEKIPDMISGDFKKRRGDCIYDYSSGNEKPLQRKSVHNKDNVPTDLGGEYALLSNHFYYFGSEPVEMPEQFKEIIHNQQGHKSNANDRYKDEFVLWLEKEHKEKLNNPVQIPGMFLGKELEDENIKDCSGCRKKSAEEDEEEFKKGNCK